MKYLQPLLLTAANSVTETVQWIWLHVSPQSNALCELDSAWTSHPVHSRTGQSEGFYIVPHSTALRGSDIARIL
jgi:hypothetical protein